jgi:MYXO-CTERM domain-containing protein
MKNAGDNMNKYHSLSRNILLGGLLLAPVNSVFAWEPVAVSEPGPLGLFLLAGVALLLAGRFKSDR